MPGSTLAGAVFAFVIFSLGFFYGPFVNDNLLYFFVNSNNIRHRTAIHSGKDSDYLHNGHDCLIVLRLAEHKKRN